MNTEQSAAARPQLSGRQMFSEGERPREPFYPARVITARPADVFVPVAHPAAREDPPSQATGGRALALQIKETTR